MGQGECIAGLLPVWILRYADSTLLERIQDICHFMIAFHTPISLSTPHIYISTRPFLPSQSPLSRIFSRELSRAIKIRSGNLLTWPAPPLEWTGHESGVISLRYSPNGYRVVTGSSDKTIRIWDAESGAVVGEPLSGHNGAVLSVAYSPDGQRIISGSDDRTIRIWDAETGAAVGEPLEGHAYTIQSTAYSPDGQNIASGSHDRTVHVRDAFHHLSIQPSSCNLMRAGFCAKPGRDGWVRDSKGCFLYWVPQDCRRGLHSPALLTIPLTSPHRSVSLDFDDIAFGTSWTQIFRVALS